jgi:hypothetical protein
MEAARPEKLTRDTHAGSPSPVLPRRGRASLRVNFGWTFAGQVV